MIGDRERINLWWGGQVLPWLNKMIQPRYSWGSGTLFDHAICYTCTWLPAIRTGQISECDLSVLIAYGGGWYHITTWSNGVSDLNSWIARLFQLSFWPGHKWWWLFVCMHECGCVCECVCENVCSLLCTLATTFCCKHCTLKSVSESRQTNRSSFFVVCCLASYWSSPAQHFETFLVAVVSLFLVSNCAVKS